MAKQRKPKGTTVNDSFPYRGALGFIGVIIALFACAFSHNAGLFTGRHLPSSGDPQQTVGLSSAESKQLHGQLKRDPQLLTLDNVRRVHVDEVTLDALHIDTPLVITGASPDFAWLTFASLSEHGDAMVKGGDRNSLVADGLGKQPTMPLRDALGQHDEVWNRIVFTPIPKLPKALRAQLKPMLAAFPKTQKLKTLAVARTGWGIGMHYHNGACFLLTQGLKKWYLGPPSVLDDAPTHPGFYTTKSSHKIIQKPGEMVCFPDEWAHEIFNLEPSVGIQSLSH